MQLCTIFKVRLTAEEGLHGCNILFSIVIRIYYMICSKSLLIQHYNMLCKYIITSLGHANLYHFEGYCLLLSKKQLPFKLENDLYVHIYNL